ncbi:hypothetical protein EXS70_02085 [Candidatus Peribacteria bacterium]|nr:hypothetical protein [Candidatus Peribacteria bacterium]
MPDEKKFTVLFRAEEESWNAFARRIRESSGEVIVVLSSADNTHLLQEEDRAPFLEECAKIRYRLRLASKEPIVASRARKQGIRVIDRTRQLRSLLAGHERSAEALRFFSPSLWRQQWRSRLQTVGLLSVPKARIWVLLLLSVGLFLFVIFRLLPSATVDLWPRSDLVTQTMNITLVSSGAHVEVSSRVRVQPLINIRAHVHKSITFDDISPEFTGNDAHVEMTIMNESGESYSFRKGTRLLNQAGMIFKLRGPVTIPAGGKVTVASEADHVDLYDKIIGKRGNVPAGLQWEFTGLPVPERKLVYAKNEKDATGGTTSERTVLQQSDLDLAVKRLKQELLLTAKQLVEEERELRSTDPKTRIELLAKDDVIQMTYTGFVLPMEFLGQPVLSVPIEGDLTYVVPAYNLQAFQEAYSSELQSHTTEGKRLLSDSVHIDPLKVIIIEYEDDGTDEHKYTGRWIKVTADVVGTEQFVIDPLTPMGAKFSRKVRDAIAGLPVKDAQRILRNFPEVERVDIHPWPPWSGILPTIPSNITITSQ